MNIVFTSQKKQALRLQKTAETNAAAVQVYFIAPNEGWTAEYAAAVRSAGAVAVLGDQAAFAPEFTVGLEASLPAEVRVLLPPGLTVTGGHRFQAEERLRAYCAYDGENNRRFFLAALGAPEGEILPPPERIAQAVVWHPERGNMAWEDWCATAKTREPGAIGYVFHREQWLDGETGIIEALIRATEEQGVPAFGLACRFGALPEIGYGGIDGILRDIGKLPSAVSVLVTLQQQSMSGMNGFRPDALQAADVPILQAYTLYTTEEKWEENPDGMGVTELGTQVILPETDGVLHSLPVAAVQTTVPARTYAPVTERVQATARKAVRWSRLHRIPPAEKRVVIVLHNYPPRNSNIGSAAGLDTPASLWFLLRRLKDEGYCTGPLPSDPAALMERILSVATNDRDFLTEERLQRAEGKFGTAAYEKYFAARTTKVREDLSEAWGEPPGEVFLYDDELLIPGLSFGNIWVTVQPPRGFGEDPGAVYHSPTLPPTHHYLAFYEWLRSGWQADAVVHLGTHGSLEWLPGKGTGLSASCYPDVTLAELPNVYPYWLTIVGEGIQAKRRSSACLIGHLSPPQTQAGLYGDYEALAAAVDQYRVLAAQGPVAAETEADLRRRIEALELLSAEELAAPPDDWLGKVHARLEDLLYLTIRTGLHILGNVPSGELLEQYVAMLTETANGEVPSLPETLAALAAEQEEDASAAKATAYRWRDEYIAFLAESNFTVPTAADVCAWRAERSSAAARDEELQRIAAYCAEVLVPALLQTENELAHTLTALAGHYIESALGGAPTAGRADILPSGRNFTSADPHTFPTPNAERLGKELSAQALARFVATEGHYPESIGIVLWATAQMRTEGQCLAEIFDLLGVRPLRAPSGRLTGLELIPQEELQHPRLDVLMRISGLFRDTMPMSAAWLDEAIRLVAAADESTEWNYVRKHALEDAAALEAEGAATESAWEAACLRVFGDPPGAYGAGVGLVLEQKNWETTDDLAQVYETWSGYAFRPGGPAKEEKRMFRRRLEQVELTLQNADNRESHLLNSDDYNAYHGGLNAAVEAVRGQAPVALTGDSSRRNAIQTRSVAEETDRLIRGEALNPKYIEGMQRHGYKGAQELANYVAHFYQWDATSHVATDWHYDALADRYVLDEELRQWFAETNPWALQRLTEVLLEAQRRGMWETSDERLAALEESLLQTEGALEEAAEI